MITPQNIFRHEIIGLYVEIVESSHRGFIGIKGKVVDETKNTISIEQEDGIEKIVPKKVAKFHFNLSEDNIVEIEGRIFVSRPENRIKKKFKR
jgi:ribonuclease P protein subunit POP4